jgi:phosphotransferase system  glucose/maltose/N-acetylglucosamine-specific IIC component
MHYGRVVAAAIVAWLAYLVVSPIANNLLLADLYAEHAAIFRPQAQMNLVLGFAASAVGFLVFAYAYAKGYEGGVGAVEGLRFGVIVGLLLSCFAVVWNYVVLPLSGTLAVAWVADTIAEMAVYGLVVGLVYRPTPPRRPAGRGTR